MSEAVMHTHAQLTISDKVRSPLADAVFGQFMERATFGEPGPEDACDDDGRLRPQSLHLVKQMAPPVVRFPGGTDIDFLDWHDLIDYAPGRASEQRPAVTERAPEKNPRQQSLGTRFGLVEFLECMQEIGSEPILVMNIGDSWMNDNPSASIQHHCAAMLAYVNAPLENNLPAELKAYPEARARAGHPQPFAVKKWQIGNETWILHWQDKSLPQDEDQLIAIQRERLAEAIQQLRAIDPNIEIIIDGGSYKQISCNYPAFKDQVDYFSYHHYKPMGGPILKDAHNDLQELPVSRLDSDELFNWMLAAPDMNQDGESSYDNETWDYIRQHNIPIAFTEWNWNGWFKQDVAENNWHWRGLGAAGMLHGIMREAQHVKLACQSMFIGSGWGIMSICVDRNDAFVPFMHPSGMVTDLYKQHHGNELVDIQVDNVEHYDPKYTNGGHKVCERVARIDALVSRDAQAYYIHVINRHRHDSARLVLNSIAVEHKKAIRWSIEQSNSDWSSHRQQAASNINETALTIGEDQIIEVPKASVSVIRIER